MVTEMGIVKTLVGTATATASDGSQRTLLIGDRVYADEIIITDATSNIEIEFSDGGVLDLGKNSQTLLDNNTINSQEVANLAVNDDINAIQQALLRGEDPTQVAQATSAGTRAGAGAQQGNEGVTFVNTEYLAPVADITSGFDTNGPLTSNLNELNQFSSIESDNSTTTLTLVPSSTINLNSNITSDNIINAAESNQNITITGVVGSDINEGDLVILTVNNQPHAGTVSATGTFAIDVAGADLVADPDQTVDASVTTIDDAGNELTFTDSKSYSTDTDIAATITLDNITDDNIINIAEAGATTPITGTVGADAKPGDTVTLTINNNTYTGLVAADNTFSIGVPGADLVADADKAIDATVTTTDVAGNSATADTSGVYTVATTELVATIELDPITGDSVIDATEASANIPVTGTVGADVKPGDTVTLTINNNPFTGTVAADNTFSIQVPGADLVADADKTIDATVTATDEAGNSATADTSGVYTVPTTSLAATIELNPITGDNVIDTTEAAATIPVTGTVGADVKQGDTVTLTINNNTYTGIVAADNTFSIEVPGADLVADADKTVDASVTTSDADNSATAETSGVYTVPATGLAATIELDPITGDSVIDTTEAAATIPVTGTVGADVKQGDTVTLTINNNTYTGIVAADNTFSIEVPGADLVADADKTVDASVTTSDADNSATAETSGVYAIATTSQADSAITPEDTELIGSLSASNISNFTINGTNGDFNANDTATIVDSGALTINGDGSYKFIPVEHWSGTVPEVSYTTDTGESNVFNITVTPVADAPELTVTVVDEQRLAQPPSQGLEKTVYSATGQDRALLESIILEDLTDAFTQVGAETVTQAYRTGGVETATNIEPDSIEVTTGLIYLEQDSSISFSGYTDDSLLIELGGKTLVRTTGDMWGDYDSAETLDSITQNRGTLTTTGLFVADQSGYYTLEIYVYNHAGPGHLSVNVSVNGEATTALSSADLDLYPDNAAINAPDNAFDDLDFDGQDTDGGFYSAESVGYAYTLNLDASLIDADGSEALSGISLTDLPTGTTITNGANADGTYNPGSFEFVSDHILSEAEINTITGSVTSTESANNVFAETIETATLVNVTARLLVELDTSGDDIIYGGTDDRILTGGAGADDFIWTKAETALGAHDIVTDFNADEGDTLNLADLLSDGSHTIDGLAANDTEENGEHLQISIKDSSGDIVQTIDLTSVATENPVNTLNELLATDSINQGF